MTKVVKVIDTISDWTGKTCGLLIWLGLLVIIYDIVSRSFFNRATVWAYGTYLRIFAVYFVIGGAYGVFRKAHIRIDVVYNLLSSKAKAIVELVLYPLTLFFTCYVLLWQGSNFAWNSLKILELDASPFHAPLYPIKLVIPLAGLLLLLQGLAEVIHNYKAWRQNEL